MPQISVIVLTYNPDNKKLRQTLAAIASQKEASFEVIISDDGSARKDFSFLPEYLQSLGITDYRLLAHEENRGTVGSCLSAVRAAAGEYVFLTSPGDYLFDEFVLRDFWSFTQTQKADLCFGNAVFYAAREGKPYLTKTEGTPSRPDSYAPDASEKKAKRSFFGGNWIIGASYFRRRDVFLACLEQIQGEAKYMEDTPTTAFAMAAGHRLYYFDRNVVWYEDGTGVSTGTNEKWKKLLHKDALQCFRKLKQMYPSDPCVDITYRNLSVNSRIKRILGKLLSHPILMLQLAAERKTATKQITCQEHDLVRLEQLLKIM